MSFSVQEKARAGYLARRAVRDGLIRPKRRCETCRRRVRLDMHHDDYAYPLRVRFLCRRCHRQWHATYTPRRRLRRCKLCPFPIYRQHGDRDRHTDEQHRKIIGRGYRELLARWRRNRVMKYGNAERRHPEG